MQESLGKLFTMLKRPRGFLRRRLRRFNLKNHRSVEKKKQDVPNLAAVQGSRGLFQDSTGLATFNWANLVPSLNNLRLLDGQSLLKKGPVLSLKDICAESLAKNIECIDPANFDGLHWSILSMVWSKCLQMNKDSPRIFSIFASKFYKEKTFVSHSETRLNHEVAKIRQTTIADHRLLNSKKHRIEVVFLNVRIRDIISYVHKLECCSWVFLDLSGFRATKDELLQVVNIQNLVCLDLSNSLVDDSFLNSLTQSILREDKLSKLTIIRLVNCSKITADGLRNLMKIQSNDNYSLSYVELDICLYTNSSLTLHGLENWVNLPESKIYSFPLALKLHSLFKIYRHSIITNSSSRDITINPTYLKWSKDFVLLDLTYVDIPLEQKNRDDALTHGWKLRGNLKPMKECFSYIKATTKVKQEILSQSRLPSSPRPPLKKGRPQMIKPNANNFFGM